MGIHLPFGDGGGGGGSSSALGALLRKSDDDETGLYISVSGSDVGYHLRGRQRETRTVTAVLAQAVINGQGGGTLTIQFPYLGFSGAAGNGWTIEITEDSQDVDTGVRTPRGYQWASSAQEIRVTVQRASGGGGTLSNLATYLGNQLYIDGSGLLRSFGTYATFAISAGAGSELVATSSNTITFSGGVSGVTPDPVNAQVVREDAVNGPHLKLNYDASDDFATIKAAVDQVSGVSSVLVFGVAGTDMPEPVPFERGFHALAGDMPSGGTGGDGLDSVSPTDLDGVSTASAGRLIAVNEADDTLFEQLEIANLGRTLPLRRYLAPELVIEGYYYNTIGVGNFDTTLATFFNSSAPTLFYRLDVSSQLKGIIESGLVGARIRIRYRVNSTTSTSPVVITVALVDNNGTVIDNLGSKTYAMNNNGRIDTSEIFEIAPGTNLTSANKLYLRLGYSSSPSSANVSFNNWSAELAVHTPMDASELRDLLDLPTPASANDDQYLKWVDGTGYVLSDVAGGGSSAGITNMNVNVWSYWVSLTTPTAVSRRVYVGGVLSPVTFAGPGAAAGPSDRRRLEITMPDEHRIDKFISGVGGDWTSLFTRSTYANAQDSGNTWIRYRMTNLTSTQDITMLLRVLEGNP